MRARFSELAPGQCYRTSKGRRLRKKVAEDRSATLGKKGRARTQKVKGDPVVTVEECTLSMIGLGMRRGAETIVEIGNGMPRRRRRT